MGYKPNTLLFNVAQQLKEAVGSVRDYTFNSWNRDDLPIQGEAHFLRTERGILVTCKIREQVRCACSRCLNEYTESLDFTFSEEFFPTVDVTTGVDLHPPEEGNFTIDEHHTLDLEDALQEYTILNTSMKPLCKAECQGLCPTCGGNLNEGSCECPTRDLDPRWVALTKLESS